MPKGNPVARIPPRRVQSLAAIADRLSVMSVDPQSSEAEAGESQASGTGHKFVVYLTLSAAVLLALGLTTAIGIRWMTQRTPSSIVVFHGNDNLVGATIQISGDDGVHRSPVNIRKTADFTTPLFLETGMYSFAVTRNGQVLFQDSMYVAEGSRYDIDMTHPPTTIP